MIMISPIGSVRGSPESRIEEAFPSRQPWINKSQFIVIKILFTGIYYKLGFIIVINNCVLNMVINYFQTRYRPVN